MVLNKSSRNAFTLFRQESDLCGNFEVNRV